MGHPIHPRRRSRLPPARRPLHPPAQRHHPRTPPRRRVQHHRDRRPARHQPAPHLHLDQRRHPHRPPRTRSPALDHPHPPNRSQMPQPDRHRHHNRTPQTIQPHEPEGNMNHASRRGAGRPVHLGCCLSRWSCRHFGPVLHRHVRPPASYGVLCSKSHWAAGRRQTGAGAGGVPDLGQVPQPDPGVVAAGFVPVVAGVGGERVEGDDQVRPGVRGCAAARCRTRRAARPGWPG